MSRALNHAALPELTQRDFERIRALIEKQAGLRLEDSRRQLVWSRLGSRLRQLGLSSFSSYYTRVSKDPVELEFLIGALTTHVTSFFREPHHFEFLRHHCAPRWDSRPLEPLRVLSAGCSSGEEAYTIAMTLRDALRVTRPGPPTIVGWDIDGAMIERARVGVYDERQVAPLTESLRARHFLYGTGRSSGKYKVKPQVSRMVRFGRANLLGAWPEAELYDAIFCRNVLIYFARERMLQLCRRFADRLKPDGLLFLGHSEGIPELRSVLQPVATSVYRTRGEASAR